MERLTLLRKEKKLTMKQLGLIFGAAESTVSNWENGNREPSIAMLIKMSAFFNVSIDYLTGASDNRKDNKKTPSLQDEVELKDTYAIPLFERVSAGVPLDSQENLEGYIYISYKPKENYFALRVHGDSMINAGIRDKSILVVHKQSYAENGDIVVALINGESTVKRFKIYGDNIFLMPENPAYEPIPIMKGADFLILGKVVEVRLTF